MPYLEQQKDYRRRAAISEGRYKVLMQHYNQQMDNATSAFNRSYYRNYLDNSNARNMLKRVREQLNEQTKAMRNTAVVTGATPEATIAAQKNNNRVLDSVVGTLANIDANAKSRAESVYEARKQQLDNFRLGNTLKYYDEQRALEYARQRHEDNHFLSFGTKLLNKVSDFLDNYYGINFDMPYRTATANAAIIPMGMFENGAERIKPDEYEYE